MRTLFFVLLISTVLAILSTSATAHPQTTLCKPHAETIEWLANEYGERMIFRGIADNGVLEVLVNPETETWSILATLPARGTCMWASGTGIEITDPVIPSVDNDT